MLASPGFRFITSSSLFLPNGERERSIARAELERRFWQRH
jgi:hypothetical protein